MAVYKIPQDVEAEDKLIGPFSFRQFIYLVVVAFAGLAAWGLYQLFPLLVISPVPVIVFFGALALPLRKDQPMEIYLAAMVSFLLKPHKRTWTPDGIDSLVEITAPKITELQRTKSISQGEAQERFGYLAEIVDSQGWAVRGQGVQAPNVAVTSDVYYEAQQVEDVLDSGHSVAQSLDFMIGKSDAKRRKDIIDLMNKPQVAPPPPPIPAPTLAPTNLYSSFAPEPPAPVSVPQPTQQDPSVQYNPYPVDIQQSVIQPIGDDNLATTGQDEPYIPPADLNEEAAPAPQSTSDKPASPDIMNLANNSDLSIATIAREANRIKDREDESEEVIISLH